MDGGMEGKSMGRDDRNYTAFSGPMWIPSAVETFLQPTKVTLLRISTNGGYGA